MWMKRPCTVLILCLTVFLTAACQRDDEKVVSPLQAKNVVVEPQETLSPTSLNMPPTLPQRGSNEPLLADMASVNIVSASEEPVGMQMPAFVEAEFSGRDIEGLSLWAGRTDEDGTRQLFSHQQLASEPAAGEKRTWSDGVHELVHVWYTVGDFLTDANNGDFVILWNSEQGETIQTVNGRYRLVGTEEYVEAVLIVDVIEGRSSGLIELNTGQQISPQSGDEFQVTNLQLADNLSLMPASGVTLQFNDAGQLHYEKRPLPGGNYFLGLSLETESGETVADFIDLIIGNENLRSGYRAYYDPLVGYQFLYPTFMSELEFEENRLIGRNISDTMKLTITAHPDFDQKSASDLKSEVLRSYGDVQILYEDTAPIGSTGALWTAYGYDSEDGSHTGVLLIFNHGEKTYVVDIDGRSADESTILEMVRMLSESWVTRPGANDQADGNWRLTNVDGIELMVPADFQYAKLTNDWHRFSLDDGTTFIAIRSESASGGRILDRTRHWLGIAGNEVSEFAYSDFYTVELPPYDWIRLDFSYEDHEALEMSGSIMATRIRDQIIFLWFEAPADQIGELEQQISIITITISGLVVNE